MRKEPNKKLIGIFMVSGFLVLLAVFAYYVKEKVFSEDGKMIVMYFEESINGLNVGSPVVFKGVHIGKVVSIDLIADAKDLEFSIPVYARVEPRKNVEDSSFDERAVVLDELIAKGLRARLVTQSYLTGMLMIELELLPGTPIHLHHSHKKDVLEIPTTLSPIGELSKGIQNLPIQKSVAEFNKFFATLNAEFPKFLPQITRMVNQINRSISDKSGASSDTLANFNRTMSNISDAARSIRNLADYLERHPESVIKGKQGAK
ncbi:MAG: MCE family protein [Alphaproteobacteria bacterium]|nr:MCE family protein [Alphaproteobacteria bacterium]